MPRDFDSLQPRRLSGAEPGERLGSGNAEENFRAQPAVDGRSLGFSTNSRLRNFLGQGTS